MTAGGLRKAVLSNREYPPLSKRCNAPKFLPVGFGNRPDLTPSLQLVLRMGMTSRIWGSRAKPVSGITTESHKLPFSFPVKEFK